MKKIGIIGALQLEVDLLIEAMIIDKAEILAGKTYYIGRMNRQEVVVTSSGVGKVNVAACTQILISNFQVDAIINTGIAGGLENNLEVGDVVVSSDVTHHDVRPGQMLSCFPNQASFQADKGLREMALEVLEKKDNIRGKHYAGRIVSGESFIDNQEDRRRIYDSFKPFCVEMEGSAVGHVAYINGVPFLVIRSISDKADQDATMSYEAFEALAAHQSSDIVLSMMEMMSGKQE